MSGLEKIVKKAEHDIATASTVAALETCRVEFLGKKGALTEHLKSLGQLSAAERPAAGQAVNEAKQKLEALIRERETILEQAELAAQLAKEKIDITLPCSSTTSERRLWLLLLLFFLPCC